METVSQVIIPTVTETSARGERIFDIYSLLLRERIVFLGSPINDQIANLIIAQLLYLEREDSEKDINLYVHCPGGIISAGDALAELSQVLPLGSVLTAAAHDHESVRGAFDWSYGLVADRRGQLSSLVPDVRGPLRRPESSA